MPYYVRTIRSHQQTVPRVNAVAESIRNLASQIHGRYPIAHPANRGIVNLQNVLSKFRAVLDDDFHSLISDDEARRLGNIYYVGSCPHTTFPRLERQEAVGIVDDDSDVDLTEADSDDEEEEEEDTERDEVISRLLNKRDCVA